MNPKDTGLLPELLAPAGSEESLRAALAAGADAVYFGSSLFSNRMRAKNFAGEALSDAIRLTHAAGARAHITVNTRVRDREMDDALRLAEQILAPEDDSRCDAVIIADLGLAEEIKKRWPHAVLHASTQTSMGSADDCRILREHGFARLVLPRELSREEIAELVRGPLEIEIFLHGAHCVSCSGQCLLSFFCGGRSGNRGECAQPCRLPYRVSPGAGKGTKTPLSLADMCLAGKIPAVIGTGVRSLKIEGRLKAPAYVYGVTSVYRRLLDERRAAEPEELAFLEALFTRGFSDGYFTSRYGTLTGRTAKEDPSRFPSEKTVARDFTARMRREEERRTAAELRPVGLRFVLKRGEAAGLTLSCGAISVTAEGEIPEEATGTPLDGEAALRSFSKLGGTGFTLDESRCEIRIDDGLWMPVSKRNELRRRAAELLADALKKEPGTPDTVEPRARNKTVPYRPAEGNGVKSSGIWTLEAADPGALTADPTLLREISREFSRIYIPAQSYEAVRTRWSEETELAATLPVFPLPEDGLARLLGKLTASGCRRAEGHTPGQIAAIREAGMTADLSFRGNVTNAAAIAFYRALGTETVGLSPELPCGAVRAYADEFPVSVIAGGRVPVMTLARCVLRPGNPACTGCGGRDPLREKPDVCRGTLTDRTDAVFPVFGGADCANTVYNAVPLWMGDRLPSLGRAELRFLWTDESPAEMRTLVLRYRRGEAGEGRRIP